MQKLEFAIRFLTVIALLGASLYFGISGYLSVDVKTFKAKADAARIEPFKVGNTEYNNTYEFLYEQNDDLIQKLFPYLKEIPESLALIITALAFGMLGGLARLIKQTTFDGLSLLQVKFLSLPVFGMLSGIFVLGITYVIPTILVEGDQKIRSETLIFLSLFAGLLCDKFYEWLNGIFENIFKN